MESDSMMVAFGLLIAVGAGALAARFLRDRRVAEALSDLRVSVPAGPFALGQAIECRAEAVIKGTVEVGDVRLTLECFETISWWETRESEESDGHRRSERVRCYREQVVWKDERTVAIGRQLQAGEPLAVDGAFTIPREGCPPTFRAPGNRTEWRVVCRASVPGTDREETASIEVEPRVLAGAR